MQVTTVLNDLRLGNSVAEADERLDRYFVDTHAFQALINGECDIIAGDKGTGKTAMYRILVSRQKTIPQLSSTRIITAFNPSGDPIFKEFLTIPQQSEGQYIAFWKTYFLSLCGNWLVDESAVPATIKRRMTYFLESSGLRTIDTSPRGVFKTLIELFPKSSMKSIELGLGFSETGLPQVKPKLEFGDAPMMAPTKFFGVDYQTGLKLLDSYLREAHLSFWIAMDRLDEAFQGFINIEIPALRALLRTYLDLKELNSIRFKLFLRKDLFQRIISADDVHGANFVNLTHVNSRRLEIEWDQDDLKYLIVARLKDSQKLLKEINSSSPTGHDSIFERVFPEKVSQGEKQSKTWKWIISRITDGNDVIAPRNLIDLVEKARQFQLRAEARLSTPRQWMAGEALIEADAIKKAHKAVSELRTVDTLFAENAGLRPFLEKFRKEKAEQSLDNLSKLLDLTGDELARKIRELKDLGFLRTVGNLYKVPSLYREGLGIRQGKVNVSKTTF